MKTLLGMALALLAGAKAEAACTAADLALSTRYLAETQGRVDRRIQTNGELRLVKLQHLDVRLCAKDVAVEVYCEETAAILAEMRTVIDTAVTDRNIVPASAEIYLAKQIKLDQVCAAKQK